MSNRKEGAPYGQGDVRMFPIEDIPAEAKVKKDGVVAEGEATGHAHRVSDIQAAMVLEHGENMFINAPDGTTITHEEHKPITLPPGKYKVGIVQEFDHFEEESRRVQD